VIKVIRKIEGRDDCITDPLLLKSRTGDKGLDQAKTGPTDSKPSAGKFFQLSLAVAVLSFSLF
jgi:hypothetical protein